ncbi:MAG: hypothetical protein ABIQ95_04925 [Bdellovibrionia bacterium]
MIDLILVLLFSVSMGACNLTNNAPPLLVPLSSPSSPPQEISQASVKSGRAVNNVLITFYGFDDNDDGKGHYGNATISDPRLHKIATEDLGTFDHPSTFATDYRVFKAGSLVYIPKFRKYYIMEDTCVGCSDNADRGKRHIDLYIGGNTSLQGNTLISCENYLTGSDTFTSLVIENPSNNWPVVTQKLYSSGVCSNQIFSETSLEYVEVGGSRNPSSVSPSQKQRAVLPTRITRRHSQNRQNLK